MPYIFPGMKSIDKGWLSDNFVLKEIPQFILDMGTTLKEKQTSKFNLVEDLDEPEITEN